MSETQNGNFVCQGFGDPLPNITWYFNGIMNLTDGSKYNIHTIIFGENILSFLTIINAESSDVGTYSCEAENIIGSDISSGILTVNGRCIVEKCVSVIIHIYFILFTVGASLTEPSNGQTRYLVEGDNITFRCIGEGYPPPLVEWRREAGFLSERTSNASMLMSTTEGNVTRVIVDLTFTQANRNDTGVYECTVWNLLNAESATTPLVVRCTYA